MRPPRRRLTLVASAEGIPISPFLGVPLLAGFFRSRGLDVDATDLGPVAFRSAVARFPELRDRAARACMGRAAGGALLAAAVGAVPDTFAGTLGAAIETLAGPRFWDARAFVAAHEALAVLDLLLEWLGAPGPWERDPEPILSPENPWRSLLLPAVPEVLRSDPEIVGLSVATRRGLLPALTMASLLREARPGVPVVLGGSGAVRLPRPAARALPFIDAVCHGRGEPFLYRLAAGEDAPRRGGRFREPPPPDFSRLDLSRYLAPAPVLPYLASRGCPWSRCLFCSEHYPSRSYREVPARRVARDLESLAREHPGCVVQLNDLAIEAPRMAELAEALLERGSPASWSARIRVDPRLDARTLACAARAGCRMLSFGLESADQSVLDRMRKGTRRRDLDGLIRAIGEAGIFPYAYVMLGFPGERLRQARRTLAFLAEHPELGGAVSVFEPDARSPLGAGAEPAAPWVRAERRRFLSSLDERLGGLGALMFRRDLRESLLLHLDRAGGRLEALDGPFPDCSGEEEGLDCRLRSGCVLVERSGRPLLVDLLSGAVREVSPFAARFLSALREGVPWDGALRAMGLDREHRSTFSLALALETGALVFTRAARAGSPCG